LLTLLKQSTGWAGAAFAKACPNKTAHHMDSKQNSGITFNRIIGPE
jgi:hypothetical protein